MAIWRLKHLENRPVTLDHCFGRIVLDNAVGKDRPWTEVVKSPAIKNMSTEQLRASIDLGTQVSMAT